MSDQDAIRHALRQSLETDLWLGVGFVPLASSVPSDDASSHGRPTSDRQPAAASESVVELKPSTSSSPAPAAMDESGAERAARKQRLLDELRARHDKSCPHCTTATYHARTVFGEGNPDARLMFVGEAPGEEEDRTGRPFVGRAGQKLDDIIRAMGLKREDVYIANVLKSRPPENRTPLQVEVDACGPFLAEQIRIIRPTAIVALGGPASKLMLQTDIGITRLRGQWASYSDGELEIPVMPTFHPAYILRNYTVETRQKVWSDMQAVLNRLAGEKA